MNELFAVFQNVDKDSLLKVVFEYTFKIEEDDLTKFLKTMKKVFSYLWNGPAEKKEEKPEEKPDFNLFMNMWWNIESQDPYMKELITTTMNAVLAPFFSKGGFEKQKKPSWIPMTFSQIINFFHLPTKANFIKGLEYTVYRKLPYPTTIPTPENTPAKQLTLIGDTDYRGEKIRF